MTNNNIDHLNETFVDYPEKTEATALAFKFREMAEERHGPPVLDDDGVVRSGHLERDGNRLYMREEPEYWFELSVDGFPKNRHEDGAELPHGVQHQDAPMTKYHGWHETTEGWLLVSSDGASWQPEAYVPAQAHEADHDE